MSVTGLCSLYQQWLPSFQHNCCSLSNQTPCTHSSAMLLQAAPPAASLCATLLRTVVVHAPTRLLMGCYCCDRCCFSSMYGTAGAAVPPCRGRVRVWQQQVLDSVSQLPQRVTVCFGFWGCTMSDSTQFDCNPRCQRCCCSCCCWSLCYTVSCAAVCLPATPWPCPVPLL
jgi:hypothetical protein